MINEKIVELLEKPKRFLTKLEYEKIKKGEWKEKKYEILGTLADGFLLYSKHNTIPITNFFIAHKDECWVEGNREKTVENYIKKIWSLEDEKELYTRIIRDFYEIIKMYLEVYTSKDKLRIYKLPSRKKNYRLIPLERRKKLKSYPFLKDVNPQYLRKIDQYIFDNISELKMITNEDIFKWVEYMMLWGTFDGVEAEIKLMEFLNKNLPEIEWVYGTEKEDASGIDIKGIVNGHEIKIQVKLATGGRAGERGVDYSEVITLFCIIENGKLYIAPKEFGNEGWISYFLKIYSKIKKINYIEYLKRRKFT